MTALSPMEVKVQVCRCQGCSRKTSSTSGYCFQHADHRHTRADRFKSPPFSCSCRFVREDEFSQARLLPETECGYHAARRLR